MPILRHISNYLYIYIYIYIQTIAKSILMYVRHGFMNFIQIRRYEGTKQMPMLEVSFVILFVILANKKLDWIIFN